MTGIFDSGNSDLGNLGNIGNFGQSSGSINLFSVFDTDRVKPTNTKAWADGLDNQKGLYRCSLQELDLNRAASQLSSSDLDKYNLTTSNAKGFRWRDGDNTDDDWRPQGICDLSQTNPTSSWLIVSWYSVDKKGKKNKGVRLSFVNITPNNSNRLKYRHVLLVEQTRSSRGFKAVDIHAGGITYCDGLLYVADTSKGIRVFDLNNIYGGLREDDDKNDIGFSDNKAYAFDYRYILPQSYHYDKLFDELLTSDLRSSYDGTKFSYLSMDWSDNGKRLLTGSYINDDQFKANERSRMFLWSLDANNPEGPLAKAVPKVLFLPEGIQKYIQGAVRYGGKLYVSRSTGIGVSLHTVTQRVMTSLFDKPGFNVSSASTRILPTGTDSDLGFEDLNISQSSNILWGLSEGNRKKNFVGDRIVFSVEGVK